MGDVTSNRQPMRVREAERESAAEGGCVFLSLQHQQREEEQNQFHRKKERKGTSREGRVGEQGLKELHE